MPAAARVDLFASLRAHAAALPEKAAILAPGNPPLTYRRLQAWMDETAATLGGIGLKSGDTVAAVLPDGSELLCAFLGIAGVCAFAPLNPALAESEFERMLSDLRPAVLIAWAGLSAAAVRAAGALGIPVLEAGPSTEPGAGLFRVCIPNEPPVRCSHSGGDDAALLLHTSATTGRAKVVAISHAKLYAMAANSTEALGLTANDRFLSMMPLFHLQGLLSSVEQLMACGSVVCAGNYAPGSFRAWMGEFHPTWYTAGPALHRAILAEAREDPTVLWRSPLRFARSIGAALPPAVLAELEEALAAPVLEGYGLTEAGPVTSNPLPPGVRKTGSAGVKLGVDVSIIDEAGNVQTPGATGEIVVRGPSVIEAYRDDPEATRGAFRDGWLRTGDLGYFDSDGYLFVVGRVKEMINRGGEKILPGEIDHVLQEHPAVMDAAAFSIPHPTLGEDVAAAVVLRSGSVPKASELRQFAATRLAPFKVPHRIMVLDAIPKSPTGKPQRGLLAKRAQAEAVAGATRALSPLEEQLVGIWERALPRAPVGVDDDFFALGGDSFALTLMLAEVQDTFGEIADPSEFFASATVATLARLIESRSDAPVTANPSVLALQPHGPRAPIFCVPGVGMDPYYFRHLVRRLGGEQPFYVLRDLRLSDLGRTTTIEQLAQRLALAVHSVRPDGPYVLSGHCFGGIIAFELARQLALTGDPVSLLVLFDTPTPGYPKVLRRGASYVREAVRFPFNRNVTARDVFAHMRFLAGLARRRLQNRLPQSAQPWPPYEIAARQYSPQPYPGRICVILAAEQCSTRILEDVRLGWQDFARGGFEYKIVPGDHNTMFTEPYVHQVGDHLEQALRSLRPPLAV